jgi:hypothetical protein
MAKKVAKARGGSKSALKVTAEALEVRLKKVEAEAKKASGKTKKSLLYGVKVYRSQVELAAELRKPADREKLMSAALYSVLTLERHAAMLIYGLDSLEDRKASKALEAEWLKRHEDAARKR